LTVTQGHVDSDAVV